MAHCLECQNKIAEFKTWLANNPHRRENLPNWESFFQILESDPISRLAHNDKVPIIANSHNWERYYSITRLWYWRQMKEIYSEVEKEIDFLVKQSHELQTSLTEQKNAHQQLITSSQSQLNAKDSELTHIRNETNNTTSSLRAEITELKTQLETVKEENNRLIFLEKQLQETTNLLTISEEQLTSLQKSTAEQLAVAEQEKLLSEQIRNNLQQEKSDLIKENKHLEQNLTKITQDHQKLVKDYQKASDNITNLKTDKQHLTKKIKNLEETITTIFNNYQAELSKKENINNLTNEKDNWLSKNWKTLTVISSILIASYYLLTE